MLLIMVLMNRFQWKSLFSMWSIWVLTFWEDSFRWRNQIVHLNMMTLWNCLRRKWFSMEKGHNKFTPVELWSNRWIKTLGGPVALTFFSLSLSKSRWYLKKCILVHLISWLLLFFIFTKNQLWFIGNGQFLFPSVFQPIFFFSRHSINGAQSMCPPSAYRIQ